MKKGFWYTPEVLFDVFHLLQTMGGIDLRESISHAGLTLWGAGGTLQKGSSNEKNTKHAAQQREGPRALGNDVRKKSANLGVYFGPLRLGRLDERLMRIEDQYGNLKRKTA